MFNIQFPLPENSPSLFEVTYGTNDAIDFCIWVLEQDGLQVPPFDQHPEGSDMEVVVRRNPYPLSILYNIS